MPSADLSRLEAVLHDSYGLSSCSIAPLPLGMMNRGYRVERDGHTHFLKDYDTRIYEPDQIVRACDVQMLVGRAGVPVPEVMPNVAGALVTETAEGFCTLSAFAAGRSFARPSIPSEAARAMGQALGQMHAAMEGIEPPQPCRVHDPERARQWLAESLALAAARRARSRVDEISCQVLERKLDSLERLAHLAPTFSGLKTQLTHGDYQETNVLFAPADAGERLTAVLDFDGCRHQPRASEVTRCLTLCFLDGETLLPEAWDFLAGYAREMPLAEDEVRHFAPLRAYLSAVGGFPIVDRYTRPELYQPRWDRFIRPWSAWWEEHMDEMTERLVDVLSVH